jgi:lipoic acid synthetase
VRKGAPLPPDPDEPANLAKAAAQLKLRHIVVTSVTRDDLPDGGLGHFAQTVACLRKECPGSTVEILTPDFRNVAGAAEELGRTIRPDIFNHNVETVPRLYSSVRIGADWDRSIRLLEDAARFGLATKSGLMLGLGETGAEIEEAMQRLAKAGVAVLTIGQYLQPAVENHDVVEYIPPERFADFERKAYDMGFLFVAAGPFARSSYKAHEALTRLRKS